MNEHVVKITPELAPSARIFLAQSRARPVAVQVLLMLVQVVIHDVFAGKTCSERFETFAYLVNLDHVFERVRGNERAAAFDGTHESLPLESEDGFAYRRAA